VLQRLKGWGKDPLAACIAVAAMFAEVTFDHWDGDTPVGPRRAERVGAARRGRAGADAEHDEAVPVADLPGGAQALRHPGRQAERVGPGDTRQIQAVTSSPLAIEGGRPTLIIRNETQNWNSSNGGHDMAGAIEGNAAKSEDGAARMLDICNAYRPGEDSVGERDPRGLGEDPGRGCDGTATSVCCTTRSRPRRRRR
jgi:hypothetical protein